MFQAAYKPCFLLRLGATILFVALKIERAYFFEQVKYRACHIVRLARPYQEPGTGAQNFNTIHRVFGFSEERIGIDALDPEHHCLLLSGAACRA